MGTNRSHLKSVPPESMFLAKIPIVLLGLQPAVGLQDGTGVAGTVSPRSCAKQVGVGVAAGASVNLEVGGPSATETPSVSVNSENIANARHVIRISTFIELLSFLSFFVNRMASN